MPTQMSSESGCLGLKEKQRITELLLMCGKPHVEEEVGSLCFKLPVLHL